MDFWAVSQTWAHFYFDKLIRLPFKPGPLLCSEMCCVFYMYIYRVYVGHGGLAVGFINMLDGLNGAAHMFRSNTLKGKGCCDSVLIRALFCKPP